MTEAGLVYLRIPKDAKQKWIRERCASATALVGPGRSVAACWEVPDEWAPQSPVESWVSDAILGPANSRKETDEDEFVFFANLVVRCYATDPMNPVRTLHMLLFRRRGELPYRRRTDATAPVGRDLLNTTAYSFTRDIANNTWHLRDDEADEEIVARLSRLLCWSDEETIEVSNGPHDRSASRIRESSDLIGVAHKIRYEWKPGSTRSIGR